MSIDFIFRLIGMVVFAILGVYWGTHLGRLAVGPAVTNFTVEQYAFTFGLVGALVGLILTPFLTTRPIRTLPRKAVNWQLGWMWLPAPISTLPPSPISMIVPR